MAEEAAREAQAQVGRVNRLAIASSVSVYAGLKEGPFTEDMALPVASGNPTEAFKKSFEILAGITPIKPELTSYFYALVAYTVHFTTVFPTSLRA